MEYLRSTRVLETILPEVVSRAQSGTSIASTPNVHSVRLRISAYSILNLSPKPSANGNGEAECPR